MIARQLVYVTDVRHRNVFPGMEAYDFALRREARQIFYSRRSGNENEWTAFIPWRETEAKNADVRNGRETAGATCLAPN